MNFDVTSDNDISKYFLEKINRFIVLQNQFASIKNIKIINLLNKIIFCFDYQVPNLFDELCL